MILCSRFIYEVLRRVQSGIKAHGPPLSSETRLRHYYGDAKVKFTQWSYLGS